MLVDVSTIKQILKVRLADRLCTMLHAISQSSRVNAERRAKHTYSACAVQVLVFFDPRMLMLWLLAIAWLKLLSEIKGFTIAKIHPSQLIA